MKMPVVAMLAGLLLVSLTGCQKGGEPNSSAITTSSAGTPNPAPSPAPNPTPSPASDQTTSQSGASETQIRAAIQDRLEHASNLNLKAFDTDVKKVTVQGDHAEAQVDFHVKGGPGVMQLVYQLQKRQGTWTVIDSNPAGGDVEHPTANQGPYPGAAPSGGNPHSLADTLRSFQQGGTGAPSALPPGHPQLNNDTGSASR